MKHREFNASRLRQRANARNSIVLIKDSSQWPICIINSVDKTRLSCYALTVLAQSLSHG